MRRLGRTDSIHLYQQLPRCQPSSRPTPPIAQRRSDTAGGSWPTGLSSSRRAWFHRRHCIPTSPASSASPSSTSSGPATARTPPHTPAAPPSSRSRTRPGPRYTRRCGTLRDFIKDSASSWGAFDNNYVQSSNTGSWADDDLRNTRNVQPTRTDPAWSAGSRSSILTRTSTDYADDIYADLVAGKLVIVDQSSGDPDLNKAAADRSCGESSRATRSAVPHRTGAAGHPRLRRGSTQHPAVVQ